MPRWQEMTLVGLDTETTGLDVNQDRVFEVGLVTFEAGQEVHRFSPLLNPERPMAPEASAKTGVKNEDLADKPRFADVVDEFVSRINDKVLVGYNIIGFDLPILESEMKRMGRTLPACPIVDALVLARGLVKSGRHTLTDMVRHFGITMETAHRATADADAVVRLLYAMAPNLPPELSDLIRLQAQWGDEQRARRASWRQRPDDAAEPVVVAPAVAQPPEDGRISLGPSYIYGTETDPLRAFLIGYCNTTPGTTNNGL